MHITRISTQGLFEWTSRTWGHVKSYMLEYSDDGSDWRQYMRDTDYGQRALVRNALNNVFLVVPFSHQQECSTAAQNFVQNESKKSNHQDTL